MLDRGSAPWFVHSPRFFVCKHYLTLILRVLISEQHWLSMVCFEIKNPFIWRRHQRTCFVFGWWLSWKPQGIKKNVRKYYKKCQMLPSLSNIFTCFPIQLYLLKSYLKICMSPPTIFFCENPKFFRAAIPNITWEQLFLYCHFY